MMLQTNTVKHGRLRGMYTALSDFCQTNNENAEDVLFSMLTTTLQDNGIAELAKKVNYLWIEQVDNVLSVDECLAIRIDLLQTKNMYKQQYDFLNNKGQFVYKPLYSLDQIESTLTFHHGLLTQLKTTMVPLLGLMISAHQNRLI